MKKILFTTRFGLRTSVLDGCKTNTRRDERGLRKAIEKFEKTYNRPFEFTTQYFDFGWDCLVVRTPVGPIRIKTRFSQDEIVAVAQAYKDIMPYLADSFYQPSPDFMKDKPGYNNTMFVRADLMPHQIRITDVRVERLQDISDEDCLREGIIRYTCNLYEYRGICYSFPGDKNKMGTYLTAREAFAALIDKVSGKGSWEKNPYVIVYVFKLVK